VPLFFNGSAGDVNPPTVSQGPEAAVRHGEALARAVAQALPKSKALAAERFYFRRRTIKLPIRSEKGRPILRTCSARLGALSLGNLAIVFLPGEIFVETALEIEGESPFEDTVIVGFAENSIGYVPPKRCFLEGGYEIGPGRWSFLQVGAEAMLRRAAVNLLKDLHRCGNQSNPRKWEYRRPNPLVEQFAG
jgi:hypothetical protein